VAERLDVLVQALVIRQVERVEPVDEEDVHLVLLALGDVGVGEQLLARRRVDRMAEAQTTDLTRQRQRQTPRRQPLPARHTQPPPPATAPGGATLLFVSTISTGALDAVGAPGEDSRLAKTRAAPVRQNA